MQAPRLGFRLTLLLLPLLTSGPSFAQQAPVELEVQQIEQAGPNGVAWQKVKPGEVIQLQIPADVVGLVKDIREAVQTARDEIKAFRELRQLVIGAGYWGGGVTAAALLAFFVMVGKRQPPSQPPSA